MSRLQGGKAHYRAEAASAEGAPLNSGHTHFILADDGSSGKGAWGGELPFRVAFENHLAQMRRVPLVQLVVQGGPGE
eukprot:2046504-Prymnesium_polylepis.1